MANIVVVSAEKVINGTVTNCNYMTTVQGDGWIYFNDDEFYRYNKSNEVLQINEDRHRWVDTNRLSNVIVQDANMTDINTVVDGSELIHKGQVVEDMISYALQCANDPKCGYDQSYRWGNDSDCSSLVGKSLRFAGYAIPSRFYTGNMQELMPQDFKYIEGPIYNMNNLQRGDILLARHYYNGQMTGHTCIFLGNGNIVEAAINEFGGVTGGQTGDQTGDEIRVRTYYNYPADSGRGHWEGYFRYIVNPT